MPQRLAALAALMLIAFAPEMARAQVMLRDLVTIEGVRSNR